MKKNGELNSREKANAFMVQEASNRLLTLEGDLKKSPIIDIKISFDQLMEYIIDGYNLRSILKKCEFTMMDFMKVLEEGDFQKRYDSAMLMGADCVIHDFRELTENSKRQPQLYYNNLQKYIGLVKSRKSIQGSNKVSPIDPFGDLK
ncbi:MAG: hypothetical protein ACTSP4_00720 [Candidatus Hodarchaeales archaeon]